MKKSVHIIIKICIALILMVSVIIGYWPEPQYIIEMTCISNFAIGLVFLISAIRLLKGKKDFPNVVYHMAVVTILLVFLICMGSLTGMHHMNFKGAFIFLHVINPILVVGYYFIFIDESKNGKILGCLLTPAFALAYLMNDYIIGSILKRFVYGFFEPGELSIGSACLVGLVVYITLLIIGLLVYGENRFIHNKRNKKEVNSNESADRSNGSNGGNGRNLSKKQKIG